MSSGMITNTIGSRAGLSFFLWRKHRLSSELAHDRDMEDDEEDGGEVLNWTAKLAQTTVRTGFEMNFGFSLTQKQMIEMGTFVPDELISSLLTCRRYTTFIGAVLFADVSGFTPLCETYSKFGSSGAYRLTATLNQYIGAMVDLIHTFGGDLMKFSGDAFLASWHVRINEYMYHKIHDAISCAMHIQYSLGNFVTDVGLALKVKLAISAGNFTFCVIGNESSGATYVILGLPILEVKKAESLCKSGDTVVAQSAWSFLIPQNYNYQELGRGYVKIKQILYDPKSGKRKIFDFDPHFLDHEKNRKTSAVGFENNFRSEFFAKSVMKASASLRPFIISPVLQQIEASQSLDYLIEMRRVTIMFINLIPNTKRCKAILTLVDETYRSILRSVQNKLGLINKVCLFDKDIMFLVIFGLKGYKDKDEATRALRSAYDIHTNVSAFPDVKSISIGITMGTTYCGVVGHPLRKEFTVIGAPVNKAARLMCAFQGVVSCDASVAFSSRLPVPYFEKMEPINLKGIVGPVTDIFKYDEVGFTALTDAPIIRRNNLMKKFEDMLNEISPYKAMVIIGDPRVGKSKVLQELVDRTRNAGWSPNLTPLNKKVVSHFCFVQKVIATILGSSSRSRMAKLLVLCKNDPDVNYLFKLNSYFDIKFSTPYEFDDAEVDDNKLYIKTLHKIFYKDVILIDDAEGLDSKSWRILDALTKIPGILVVISLPSSLETIESCIQQYLRNPLITVIKLENLPRKYIAPLVCQMLAVDAVPHKLIRNLYKISRGIPGWVQAFLLSYVETGAISVCTDFPESILFRKSYYVTAGHTLKSQAKRPSSVTNMETKKGQRRISPERLKICKLVDKDLKKDGIPPTFDDVIMATFDNLTPFKQLMLKCGAILGKEFQRSELEAVMSWPFNLALALGVKNLFEMDILCCASKYQQMDRTRRRSSEPSPIAFKPLMSCYCQNRERGKYGRLPKYALCNFMSFRFELLRATIYQVIPVNQRSEFHMRAFNYIRTQVMKCHTCLDYEFSLSTKKRQVLQSENDFISPISGQQGTRPGVVSFTLAKEHSQTEERRGAVLGVAKGVTFSDSYSNEGASLLSVSTLEIMENYQTAGEIFLSNTGSVLESRKFDEAQRKIMEDLQLYLPHVVNCTCRQVLSGIYKKLLYHASAADAKVEKLKILVEFGIHCVKYSNFIKAYRLLKEALELCEEIIANFSSFESNTVEERNGADTKKKKKTLSPRVVLFEKEKAKCYFGVCCTYLGYIRQGNTELTSIASTGFLSIMAYYYAMTGLKFRFSNSWKEKEKVKLALLAFAYTCIAKNYILQHDLKEAESAAKIAINYAVVVNKLEYLSSAYSTYIEVCLLLGKHKQAKKAERDALETCGVAFREKDAWDVLYIGRIYTVVFKGRMYRGELHRVSDIAKAALKTAATFRACDVEVYIYPHLIRCLADQKKLYDIADILLSIKTSKRDYSLHDASRIQRLYHKLNLLLLVEIGYCMEEPLKVIRRLEAKYSDNRKPVYSSHSIIARRQIILVWLWFLRRKEFETAKLWHVVPNEVDLLLENIPTAVTLLEGHLQWFVHCIDLEGEINPEMQRDIETRLDILEHISRKKIINRLPHLLHLKAYKTVICFDYDGKVRDVVPGLADLRAALKVAKDHGNIHCLAWVQQSMTEWYTETKTFMDNASSLRHGDSEIRIISLNDEKELYQYENEDTLYHLPLPIYITEKLAEYLSTNAEMLGMTYNEGDIDRTLLYYGDSK